MVHLIAADAAGRTAGTAAGHGDRGARLLWRVGTVVWGRVPTASGGTTAIAAVAAAVEVAAAAGAANAARLRLVECTARLW